MKLSLNNTTKNKDVNLKAQPAWSKPPPKRLSAWKIRAYIYQCQDLPSADSEGSSDPFIEVWTQEKDKEKYRTPIVEDNNNPIYYHTIEFYCDFVSKAEAPPILLNIYDHDEGVFDSDDFLGRAIIHLDEAALSEDESIPTPKWHKVVMGFDNKDEGIGEVLCSFSVVPDDFMFKTPAEHLDLYDTVELIERNVEMNILGLRHLVSTGLLPVTKAFIKFHIKSLLPPEKSKAIQNVFTTPKDPGSNPNINTMISFTLSLPKDPLYCPKLTSDVFDQIFKGLMQPNIGTFVVPLGDIMVSSIQNMEDEKEQSEFFIREL